MKKVYIVLDEPESCSECQFYVDYLSCFLEHVSIGYDEKPKNCPLKPLPETLPEDCNTIFFTGFNSGWNACIDRILEGAID